jgi:hydrogenase maturation protease
MKYVIGVGNYAMGDDGIGLQLIEALSVQELPPDCETLELKNDALGLFSYLTPETERILIVDCVKMGDAPGNWRLFSPEEVSSIKKVANATTHEGDLLQTLALARETGYHVPPIRILGIQPETLEPSMDLSNTLKSRFDEYLTAALKTIGEDW